MKKWFMAEALMLAGIIIVGRLIIIQISPVQAKVSQESVFDLLVQTQNGLVPYNDIVIIKAPRSLPIEQIKTMPAFIYEHAQSVQSRIYELEPKLSETLIKLAHCESSLNPQAVGDNGNSHGLYQIYLKWHPDVTKKQAQDIEFATRWTANKIRQGQGDLWTCWDKI